LDENATMIEYRRLRAPSEDRHTLIDPALEYAPQLMAENRQSFGEQSLQIAAKSLADLQASGRAELLELARRYTCSYRDVDLDGQSTSPIIMSGHQPKLFHPGVWFKNFVLSNLGQQLGATPINLIVDNDIAGVASIHAPRVDADSASMLTVPIDQPGKNIPFECRSIVDTPFFREFDQRATGAISNIVDGPLVERLWPLVCGQLESDSNLGLVMAKGRHLLEQEAGLDTLEVPLSQVAQSRSFGELVLEIFQRMEAFQDAYNDCLFQYRDVHHIRSNAHPVPPLKQENGFFETPFWIWEAANPIRRPLYIRLTDQGFRLTDRSDWQLFLDRSDFSSQFSQLGQRGIAIRPRALVTTLYNRLVLSDLFLHGIGGSKYDQLTDSIARRFFNYEMPKYITMTATATLPSQADHILPTDLTRLNVLARELRFHPEDHVDQTQPHIRELVEIKRHWLNQELPRGQRMERHQQIDHCNQQLRDFTCPSPREIAQEQQQLASRLKINRILRSREYSFCLFPDTLIEDLKNLAR